MDIVTAVVELLKKAATDLPADVEDALRQARERETSQLARSALDITLKNVEVARDEGRPMCQDTGVPLFFVTAARGTSYEGMADVLCEAVRRATREVPLRPNAFDVLAGKNTGDGVGDGIPVIYFREWQQDYHIIDLLLKGGGSENVGASYKLPDTSIGGQRDMDGVRRAVLHAVWSAQGRACPPYTVAVGIAGTKDDAAVLAKRQLMRKVSDVNESEVLAAFEDDVLKEINELGIGPSGLSGETTALSLKVGAHARHPATFFVDVSFACWAQRRSTLRFRKGKATYE